MQPALVRADVGDVSDPRVNRVTIADIDYFFRAPAVLLAYLLSGTS